MISNLVGENRVVSHVIENQSRRQALRRRVRRRLQLFVGLVLLFTALSSLADRPQASRAPLTIQEQIEAAPPGGVVVVGSGRFEEQLVIDKDLTLMGAGASTVIEAPATLSESFSTPSGTYYPVIYVHDAADVTIQNLVVDGMGHGNAHEYFVGIAFDDAGGRVDGVEVMGIHDAPYSAIPHGAALYAYAESGTARHIYVGHCSFHEFQKNGAAFWGADLTAQVSYNTISGRGPIDSVVQNGVVIGSGVAGIVGPNNVLSDFTYTLGSLAASGILIYSNDAAVFNNTIFDTEVGIYLWEGGGDIHGNSVTAGEGADEPWGIVATVGGPARSTAEGRAGVLPLPAIGEGEGVLAPTADLTIAVAGNSLIGDGANVDSTGVEVDIGPQAGDVALSIGDNAIFGWGDGVVLYRDSETSRVVDASSFTLRGNSIEGNLTYGMYVTGFDSAVDAQVNWWGHNSGPYDDSPDGFHNPDGQGDAVSDGVDYLHWLRRTYLPLVLRDA
jgi:nitrous oxidase accessory protein NosD